MTPTTHDPQSQKTKLPANLPSSRRVAVVSIIATILLTSIGLTIYQMKQKNAHFESKFSTVTPTPIKTQAISPTKNQFPLAFEEIPTGWKTYVDSEKLFQIRYPSEWYLYKPEKRADRPTNVAVGVCTEKSEGESYCVWVNTYDNPENLSIDRWWEEYNKRFGNYENLLSQTDREKGDVLGHPAYFVRSSQQKGWYSREFSSLYTERDQVIYGVMTNFSENSSTYQAYSQMLSTFRMLISNEEQQLIDSWLDSNNLNQYGDSKDTMYAGGTPLFDERTGERTDRYEYIIQKFPERPWNQ